MKYYISFTITLILFFCSFMESPKEASRSACQLEE